MHAFKKDSKWRPPKSNSHQLETLLWLVKKNLLAETLNKNVKDYLSKNERDALNEWRRNNLFTENGNSVIRLEKKHNKFVVFDKETNQNKAQEQIHRSSFKT